MSFPAPSDCFYVDIETDNILLRDVTKIHSIVVTYGGVSYKYSTLLLEDWSLEAGAVMIRDLILVENKTPVFHHGAGYDIAVLLKFFPKLRGVLRVDSSIDTFLLSCMLFPDRAKGHSLDAWGTDFGIAKIQNDDWTTCTTHMVDRCVVDTQITQSLYEHEYTTIMKFDLAMIQKFAKSLTLESLVSSIHQRQMDHGVMYDMAGALEHYNWLSLECSRLEAKIQRDAPWTCTVHGVAGKNQELVKTIQDSQVMYQLGFRVVEPFKADGGYKKSVVDFFGIDKVLTVQGPYSRISCTPLSLGNSDEVKDYLLSLGWKPTEYNYAFKDGRKVRNSPKLTEDSFSSIPPGLGQDIANYRTYLHRKRSILNVDDKGNTKGAISTIRNDGRITAEAITCGTPTARYRHMKTVCNIPRPSSVFGQEIRSTFTVADGHFLLGADLAGIESRMLAHYLAPYKGSEEIIKVILSTDKSEDFHTRNARIWGVDRNTAKSGLYALMYGCYPKKLATTLGYDESKGQELHDAFWSANGPIKNLIDDLEKSYDHNGGWIRGLDGRPLFIREKRKLLNTLLQNAATIVFKRWMVLCEEEQWLDNVQVHQVIAYHDELQFEVYTNDLTITHRVAERVCELALDAGVHYGVTVPTPADYKIGKDWADTH